MNSLEALEELKFQVGNITAYTHDLQNTTFKVRDSGLFEIIEKDLEILEENKELILYLIKKELWELSNSYCGNTAQERNNLDIYTRKLEKIKEWLEK